MERLREYTVDLGLPAAERWREQASDKWAQRKAKALLAAAKKDIPGYIPNAVLTTFLAKVFDVGAGEYAEELRALCDRANVNYGDAALGNLAYELSHAAAGIFNGILGCSSVAFHLPKVGMVHARNLDWPLTGMEKSTCLVHFVGASAGDFTAVTVPGLVGVLSACAQGRFSATINYADSKGMPSLYRGWSATLLLRHVFQTCKTYKAALRTLQEATTIYPAFVQLVGIEEGEGAVIELSSGTTNGVYKMTNGALAVTNHYMEDEAELDAIPDADDPYKDSVLRRQGLEAAADACRATSLKTVANILCKPPVFNDLTKQSMVFCPATGEIVLNMV